MSGHPYREPDPQPPDDIAYPGGKPEPTRPKVKPHADMVSLPLHFEDTDRKIKKELGFLKLFVEPLLTEPILNLFRDNRVDVPGIRRMRLPHVARNLWKIHGFWERREDIRRLLIFYQLKCCPGSRAVNPLNLAALCDDAKWISDAVKDKEEFAKSGDRVRTAKAMRLLGLDTKPFGVILEIQDDSLNLAQLPGGAVGTAAIYTQSAGPTHLIRRVMIRMESFLNYVVP